MWACVGEIPFHCQAARKSSGQRTSSLVGQYQQKLEDQVANNSRAFLKQRAGKNNRVKPNLIANIQFYNEFLTTSLKCANIVMDLIGKLNTYKNERKNPSWFESLTLNEVLIKERLKIAKLLVKYLGRAQLAQWDLQKYMGLIGELEQASRQNNLLTKNYNKGILTGEKPNFKAREGELQKLVLSASTDLIKYNEFFKLYFSN